MGGRNNTLEIPPDIASRVGQGHTETIQYLHQIASIACISNLEGHTIPVCGVCFSPDGQTLASASKDYTIKLWNPKNGKCIKTLKGHTGSIHAVCFSPD